MSRHCWSVKPSCCASSIELHLLLVTPSLPPREPDFSCLLTFVISRSHGPGCPAAPHVFDSRVRDRLGRGAAPPAARCDRRRDGAGPAAFARDPAAGSLGRAAPSAKSELTLPLALGCRGSGPEAELQRCFDQRLR